MLAAARWELGQEDGSRHHIMWQVLWRDIPECLILLLWIWGVYREKRAKWAKEMGFFWERIQEAVHFYKFDNPCLKMVFK